MFPLSRLVRTGLGALAVTALAVTTACSSSTGGSGAASSPSGSGVSGSSSGPSSSSSSAATAPDATALKSELLTAADLGSGWTASAADTTNSDDDAAQAQLYSCAGVAGGNVKESAKVSSQNFAKDNVTASSDASSYATADEVTTQAAIFKSPKIQDCFTTLLKSTLATSLPSGAKIDNVQVQVMPGPVSGYPSNVVGLIGATITVSADGKTETVYVNSAYITGKLTTAELDFDGEGVQPDSTVENTVLKAVAARVTA